MNGHRDRLWHSVSDEASALGSWPSALCRACCRALPSVDAASLSLRSHSRAEELLAASEEWAERLEETQYTLGEGPGVEAFTIAAPVLVSDAQADDDRWPAFTDAAASAGLGAVFAFPLQLGAILLGTLDLYRRRPGRLPRVELSDASVLAELATVTVLADAPVEELPGAGTSESDSGLGSYTDVHVATGMMAAQLRISLADAFARIRGHAFAEGRPLREVAADVVGHRISFDRQRDQD